VKHSAGTIVKGFDLRVEKGSVVDFEWRDWSEAQYLTGPHIGIREGKLRLDDGATMDLPMDSWVRFEVTAGLGESATGKWSLKVQPSGQSAREFKDLAFAKPGFKKITWVGFTSNATVATAFYLDNFSLKPR
jgi:hypothetical protein